MVLQVTGRRSEFDASDDEAPFYFARCIQIFPVDNKQQISYYVFVAFNKIQQNSTKEDL